MEVNLDFEKCSLEPSSEKFGALLELTKHYKRKKPFISELHSCLLKNSHLSYVDKLKDFLDFLRLWSVKFSFGVDL